MDESHFEETIDSLYETTRWETYPTVNDESVAEHTFEVSYISYLLALEEGVDLGPVLERALLHDLGEANIGDIPRYSKRGDGQTKEAIDDAERLSIESISEDLNGGKDERIEEYWGKAKDETDAGKIVACADIIAAMRGAKRELQLGNSVLIERSDVKAGAEDAKDIVRGIVPAEKMLNSVLRNIGLSEMTPSDAFVEDHDGLRLSYFWADWCGPCETQTPIVEELAKGDDIAVRKVDIDTDRGTEICQNFSIRSVPTILLDDGNRILERKTGIVQKEEIMDMIKG